MLALLLAISIHNPCFGGYAEYALPPDYEETSILLVVQGIGGTEVSAIVNNQVAYLSITDVFDFLKVKYNLSIGIDSVYGFFIDQNADYLIDKAFDRVRYQGKIWELLPSDLLYTGNSLCMKAELFGSIFGLDCKFNFRSLSVSMSSRLELPAIREIRQQRMRDNINRLRGQVVADTVIGRSYSLIQVNMADWSIIATQRNRGGNDTRLNLSLGVSSPEERQSYPSTTITFPLSNWPLPTIV
ncbi:hypothetical protein OKW96_16000 [Sphingobacterium sp. KU25419]|nr:hypothetical protein OKW96_16000 [Sphingobacterium sp. KU25419]